MGKLYTTCISTYNNLEYLKIAVDSVRKNSFYKDSPFIIHAENCTDGTDEWLEQNANRYNLEYYIDKNDNPKGIGGGMNFCADKVKTEFINFIHSDFYVTEDWDLGLVNRIDRNKRQWINSWRIEPKMFDNSDTTPGNIVVPKGYFGAYYDDFNSELFEKYCTIFRQDNNFDIPRALGVSGLISKRDWDYIGGNDPRFAPTSWDDHDLFWRMEREGFEFTTTTDSMIFHFGARGSHRLEENDNKSSTRQMLAEERNAKKFFDKWGGMPLFNEFGQIKGINSYKDSVSLIIPTNGSNKEYTDALLGNIQTLYGDDDSVEVIVEENSEVTLGINYNNAVKKATGDIVILLHNDMILKEGFIERIKRDITPGTVLSYTRVEPPVYTDTYPGKVILDAGYNLDDFDKAKFDKFEIEDKIVAGGTQLFFAVYKKDYIGIDGHTFVKFCEDDDIHLRYQKAGYNHKVSSAAVYHFGSKTSRVGNYSEIEQQSQLAFREKWGYNLEKENPTRIID